GKRHRGAEQEAERRAPSRKTAQLGNGCIHGRGPDTTERVAVGISREACPARLEARGDRWSDTAGYPPPERAEGSVNDVVSRSGVDRGAAGEAAGRLVRRVLHRLQHRDGAPTVAGIGESDAEPIEVEVCRARNLPQPVHARVRLAGSPARQGDVGLGLEDEDGDAEVVADGRSSQAAMHEEAVVDMDE